MTKEVLPVKADSTELTAPAPKLNARATGMLERYEARGRAFLLAQPEHRASAAKFANALAAEGNVKEALRQAGVSADAVVRGIVGVFSDSFVMETGAKGGQAHVALKG